MNDGGKAERDFAPFERRVVSAVSTEEYVTEVTLECGHQVTVVFHHECSTMPCSQCLHDYLAALRSPLQ